jgi:hypothetical protein
MSDRKKSTLPDEATGFHEVLLSLLEPEDRAAFRRVGTRLYELLLEHRPFVQRADHKPAPGEESPLHQEVAAAVVDLTTTRDFLWILGRAVEDSALGAEDARLSLLCRDLMDPLDDIIDKFQEATK